MAKQSSKHSQVVPLSYTFTAGLNLASPPNSIADGEMSDCRNVWYPLGGDYLEVRPGLEYAAAPPSGSPGMTNLHPYVKGSSASYLVASFDDGTVRYLSGANWTQFHTLTAPGVVPPFQTYHDKLIIGDIGTNLRSWDGSTVTALADSPKSTALAEIGGRLVSNSADDLDGLVFCAPEDETKWQITSGASFVRIGYGDGQAVRGFVPFAADLAVFKAGDAGGRVMRLVNAALGETNWSAATVADGSPLTGAQATAYVGNNILYGTTGGVFDLSGVQEYGSIKTGVAGRKVNPFFNGKTIRNVSHLPALGLALIFITGDYRVLVYHAYTGLWTMLDFGQKPLVGACQLGDDVYIGAADGTLYKLTVGNSSDEMEDGSSTDIAALARGKQLVLRGEAIARRARLFYELLSGAQLELSAVAPDGLTRTVLLEIDGETGAGLLADATGKLADATSKLYTASTWYHTGRARIRAQSLTAEIRSTSGRYRLRQVDFELAQVNG
jgi:hypothetical protein